MSRASFPPLEDDFSRALLGSAEADGPSNAAFAKAAAGLGLVGLGVGASLPAAAAVATGATGVAGLARWSSSLVGAKLWALGLSAVLLVGSGALLLLSSRATQPVIQSGLAHTAQAISRPARAAAVSPPSDRDLPPAVSLSPEGVGSAQASSAERVVSPAAGRRLAPRFAARHTAHSAPASAAHVSTGSSLAEQVQSLDRARVALGSGDSSSALREIAHYRAAWPNGVFLTEASVLEIEALAARGDRSLARARAADFVEAHPDSPQADRLRALIPTQSR